MPQGNPKPGERYRHFKGKEYQVICTATDSETGEQMVVYQALYGNYGFWTRPLDMFISETDRQKYPDVQQKYRFELINPEDKEIQNSNFTNKDIPKQNPAVTDNQNHNSAGTDNQNQDSAVTHMLDFLDTDDFDQKYDILNQMKLFNEFTDTIIDNMAASLDVVIDDGPIEDRIAQLMICVGTRQKYETTRLR